MNPDQKPLLQQDVYQPDPLTQNLQQKKEEMQNTPYQPQEIENQSQYMQQQQVESQIPDPVYIPPPQFNAFEQDPNAPSAPPLEIPVYNAKMYLQYTFKNNKEADGCWPGFKSEPHCCNLFLTISMIAMVVCFLLSLSDIIDSEKYYIFLIIVAVAYAIYLFECFYSSTYKYLTNIYSDSGAQNFIDQIKATTPLIEWEVQCYHYETRIVHEHYTDKDGKRHSRTRTESHRVNTHHAKTEFQFEN